MSNWLRTVLVVAAVSGSILTTGCSLLQQDRRDAPWDPKGSRTLMDQIPNEDGAAGKRCCGHLRQCQAHQTPRCWGRWGGWGYMLVAANLASSGSKSPPWNDKYFTLIFYCSNFLPSRTLFRYILIYADSHTIPLTRHHWHCDSTRTDHSSL